MDIKLEIHTDLHKMKENKTMFHSYKCDNCSAVTTGSELIRIAKVRSVEYIRSFLRFDRKSRTEVPVFDSMYNGTEIVVQERLCEGCYEGRKDTDPIMEKDVKQVNFVGERSKYKVEYNKK